MTLFWAFGVPAALAIAILLVSRRLQFFSHAARELDRIDIPNEVKELRINELEMLSSVEADFYFKHAWDFTLWQRRQAVTKRLREARKWLLFIISNAALFQEVARFHIRTLESSATDSRQQEDLAYKLMDRASMVHFMAATCLTKLFVLDLCRALWPGFVPELAHLFQVHGHDLIAWYRHLAKEMLAFAENYYDDVTYTRFIFQLTGLFTVEEASRLNRL